jgi:hypothetical protein
MPLLRLREFGAAEMYSLRRDGELRLDCGNLGSALFEHVFWLNLRTQDFSRVMQATDPAVIL